MSKALKIAAVVVAVVAITVATAGIGTGPALGASGVGIGATATTAGVTAFAGAAATGASVFGLSVATLGTISTGLSLASGLLAKKPTATFGGSPTAFKADPNAGIPYLMGRTMNKGNIVRRVTYNTPGWDHPDRQSFMVVLSGAGPIQEIESFTQDNVAMTFDSSGNAVGQYASWMWQTRQLGAVPETDVLRETYGGVLPPGWTTAHKLSGLAAVNWTLRFDTDGKFYESGLPEPRWVCKGVKVYDPRLDSTYPGGSGSCRALNEATYVYSENPYLHGLTWCLGRWQNSKLVLGLGAPVAAIDVAAFVEGANIADANAWKVGGLVYSTDSKWNALKAILQAGGGQPIALGAKISCIVDTPRVSLATVTIADMVGEGSVTATQSRRDRINTVVPRYRSEAHLWDMIPADPIMVSSYVTFDGGKRSREIEYPLVQNLTQAGQLARYDIENAREFGPVVLPLKLRWYGYKPGDCINVVLPELGLNGQQVLLLDRTLDPATGVVLQTGRSETTAKHAFALGQTATAPPTPSVSGPPLVPTPTGGSWAISATEITANGVTLPCLVVTGSSGTLRVDQILFEYRLYSVGLGVDDNWIAAGTEPARTTTKEIASVTGGTQYQISVSYRSGGVTGGRLILGPATAGTLAVPFGANVTGAEKPANNATRNVVTYAATAPSSPVDGDLWVDTSGTYAVFKLRSGGAWVTGANALTAYNALSGKPVALADINTTESAKLAGIAAGATRNALAVSASAPASPVDGDLWVDTSGTYAVFKLRSGGAWVTGANALLAYNALTGRPVALADINTTESAKLAGIEAGADVTKNYAPGISGPASVNIYYPLSSTGLPVSIQTPRMLQFTRKEGNTDVTASTTWAVTAPSGMTISTSASYPGGIRISNLTTFVRHGSFITVSSTYGGITYTFQVEVHVMFLPAPNASPVFQRNVTATPQVANSTYPNQINSVISLWTDASGTATLSARLMFAAPSTFFTTDHFANIVNNHGGSAFIWAKWQYRAWTFGGSNPWIDAAAEVQSATANLIEYLYTSGLTNFYDNQFGYFENYVTVTGLTASTKYDFRLIARTEYDMTAGSPFNGMMVGGTYEVSIT